MGFLGNITSGLVKAAITPVAIVKDAVDVAQGKEPNTTKKLLNSAGDDFERAADNACGEDG